MAKKRPAARTAPGKRKGPQTEQKAPNPFELKGSKRKFTVLGRRVKGDKKSLVQARSDAVNKRKKTLLVEYKQLRKANTFIDRRFGEDDERLDDEERSLARFQAQRLKEAARKSKFSLADGGAGGNGAEFGGLTHMGISLEELEDLNERPDALADLDDDVLEDMVKEYNFGGGADAEGREGGGTQRKTRRQVMEEIIRKSKAYKALRAQQKEADEQELADLDAAFKELVGQKEAEAKGARGGALARLLKPPGHDKGERVKADNEQDALYDRAARELVFEAKGQASERTLTPEELAEKERLRLEALEKQRLARMRASGDEEDEEAAAGDAAPMGGYAARRKRLREADEGPAKTRGPSGDALEDDFEPSGSDDEGSSDDGTDDDGEGAGGSALDRRRRQRAAGSHPLQAAFREQAARLAEKYGVEVGDEGDSDEEGASSDAGDDGEEGEESEDEGEDGEEDAEFEEKVLALAQKYGMSVGEQGEQGASGSEDEGAAGEESEGEESEGQGEEPAKQQAKQQAQQQAQQQADDQLQGRRAASAQAGPSGRAAAAAGAAQESKRASTRAADVGLEGPLDLPYTIPVPESYPEFVRLVGSRPAADLKLAVQRIRAFNATALTTDNRRKLQVFYGILVQHFAMLAGQHPLPFEHLDTLLPLIHSLTQEVPFYAATVARARLSKQSERLTAALADPLAVPTHGWPGPRALLQLQLFLTLFPVSDRRHPVVTPAVLLLGRWLSHCPVLNPRDAAMGLAVAGLALAAAAPAGRFAPEALSFLAATLRAFLPGEAKGGSSAEGASLFATGVLALGGEQGGGSKDGSKGKGSREGTSQADSVSSEGGAGELPKLSLKQVLSDAAAVAANAEHGAAANGGVGAAAGADGDAFKLALLGTVLAAARRAAELIAPLDAAPEVLAPLAAAVDALLQASTTGSTGDRGAASMQLPPAATAALRATAEALGSASAAAVARRLPLVRSGGKVAPPVVKEYNPRYEADYVKGKDYDPDRERAASRQLQRQLVREKRGAMRELRRDAAFMSAERDRERGAVDAERMAAQKRFYSELQRQEADFKSGGQGGMNPHLKKSKRK